MAKDTTISSAELTLADRMKKFYEGRTQQYLPRRTNIILRLDGVGFSKFTEGLEVPYDADFIDAMNRVAEALCKSISGAKCAFIQSDEISILVTDYDELNSGAWFDNSVQKMCSVAAAIATATFNRIFTHKSKEVDAYFDCRVFSIPLAEEVLNCFLWRQLDCTRNSIASVAQVLYPHPHRELVGKNTDVQQEMIFQRREQLRDIMIANGTLPLELHQKPDLNWNDLPAGLKRGRFITRHEKMLPINLDEIPDTVPNKAEMAGKLYARSVWVTEGAPRFSQHPEAILSLLPGYVPTPSL
jgi:tRNA(His) guanylyltransferase